MNQRSADEVVVVIKLFAEEIVVMQWRIKQTVSSKEAEAKDGTC
jgi:hypothetical protein